MTIHFLWRRYFMSLFAHFAYVFFIIHSFGNILVNKVKENCYTNRYYCYQHFTCRLDIIYTVNKMHFNQKTIFFVAVVYCTRVDLEIMSAIWLNRQNLLQHSPISNQVWKMRKDDSVYPTKIHKLIENFIIFYIACYTIENRTQNNEISASKEYHFYFMM